MQLHINFAESSKLWMSKPLLVSLDHLQPEGLVYKQHCQQKPHYFCVPVYAKGGTLFFIYFPQAIDLLRLSLYLATSLTLQPAVSVGNTSSETLFFFQSSAGVTLALISRPSGQV